MKYDGVNPITITLSNSKSYCFECNGSGTMDIEYKDSGVKVQLVSQNRENITYKGIINGDCIIKFSGDFVYTVSNFVAYTQTLSNDINYIPLNVDIVVYDFKNTDKRFVEFADNGVTGTLNYKIDGSKIAFKNDDFSYHVRYKVVPKLVTITTPEDEEVELDTDTHTLIPLLASFYIWLDDDERKATMYFNDYESKARTLYREYNTSKMIIHKGLVI